MVEIDAIVKVFLAVYFTMVGLYYAARSYAMSEREGFSFIAYGNAFSKTWWHRQLFNVFRASILGICIARLFVDIDAYLGVFEFLYSDVVILSGVVCLLASFTIVSYVAGYMNRDWFSGIAPDDYEQELVRTGPFAKTRNPLFVGIMIGQLGFFLAVPSVFSLVCLIVGFWVIRSQAKVEEGKLVERFGAAYKDYSRQVPRWL